MRDPGALVGPLKADGRSGVGTLRGHRFSGEMPTHHLEKAPSHLLGGPTQSLRVERLPHLGVPQGQADQRRPLAGIHGPIDRTGRRLSGQESLQEAVHLVSWLSAPHQLAVEGMGKADDWLAPRTSDFHQAGPGERNERLSSGQGSEQGGRQRAPGGDEVQGVALGRREVADTVSQDPVQATDGHLGVEPEPGAAGSKRSSGYGRPGQLGDPQRVAAGDVVHPETGARLERTTRMERGQIGCLRRRERVERHDPDQIVRPQVGEEAAGSNRTPRRADDRHPLDAGQVADQRGRGIVEEIDVVGQDNETTVDGSAPQPIQGAGDQPGQRHLSHDGRDQVGGRAEGHGRGRAAADDLFGIVPVLDQEPKRRPGQVGLTDASRAAEDDRAVMATQMPDQLAQQLGAAERRTVVGGLTDGPRAGRRPATEPRALRTLESRRGSPCHRVPANAATIGPSRKPALPPTRARTRTRSGGVDRELSSKSPDVIFLIDLIIFFGA